MTNSDINRDRLLKEIRDEIKKEGPELNRFLEMITSFTDEIPEEYNRYRAAMKAIKHTAKIDQYDVLKAADRQMEKLSEQEMMMASSLEGKKAELIKFQERASEIETSINELKEKIAGLEREKGIISSRLTAKESEIKTVEASYHAAASHIIKEISSIKGKIQTYLSDSYQPESQHAAHRPKESPAPESVDDIQIQRPDEEPRRPREAFSNNNAPTISSPLDSISIPLDEDTEKKTSTTRQKECPACSGQMDWYAIMKLWKCYVCGHEEKVRKK